MTGLLKAIRNLTPRETEKHPMFESVTPEQQSAQKFVRSYRRESSVNKKYADKPEKVVGEIAIGYMGKI